jgi:hypothetical protein
MLQLWTCAGEQVKLQGLHTYQAAAHFAAINAGQRQQSRRSLSSPPSSGHGEASTRFPPIRMARYNSAPSPLQTPLRLPSLTTAPVALPLAAAGMSGTPLPPVGLQAQASRRHLSQSLDAGPLSQRTPSERHALGLRLDSAVDTSMPLPPDNLALHLDDMLAGRRTFVARLRHAFARTPK